uniref:RNA polymerase II-associated factor 1 homolog n=1 Tax=Acrobeloides nanus TaxID=290746 RepID=A0A914BUF1_9BILA
MNSSQSYNRRQQPPPRKTEPKADFICKVKYTNTLPDLPFDPKFLECPFVALDRFVQYKPTSLEKNYKFELLTEPDLGVKIDLINPLTYQIPDGKIVHHPDDEKLLEDEAVTQQNLRRSQQHSKIVPWMRKTEYISTEFNRYGVSSDKSETKIGYSIRKKMEVDAYKDRDAQIATINKTFEDAKKPVRTHYSKRNVTAVEEIPLFPDYELWKYPFAQVIFDTDPLPFRKNENSELLMEHALIRGMMDNEGNQFVAYFAPTSESLAKRVEEEAEGRNFTEGEK